MSILKEIDRGHVTLTTSRDGSTELASHTGNGDEKHLATSSIAMAKDRNAWNEIEFEGTPTPGQVAHVTIGGVEVTYTVLTGDNTSDVIRGLHVALEASASIASEFEFELTPHGLYILGRHHNHDITTIAVSVTNGTGLTMELEWPDIRRRFENIASHFDAQLGQHTASLSALHGLDKYGFNVISVNGTISAGDIAKVTIDGQLSQYTVLSGDTIATVCAGIVAAINANTNVNTRFVAHTATNAKEVHILSLFHIHRYEVYSLKLEVTGSGLSLSARDEFIRRWWSPLSLIPDQFGDMGALLVGGIIQTQPVSGGGGTDAGDSLYLFAKKTLASTAEQVFFDRTVDVGQTWVLTDLTVSAQNVSATELYLGRQRARVENFVGNGTNKNFACVYSCPEVNGYVQVRVDGVLKTITTDYDLVHVEPLSTLAVAMKTAPVNNAAVQVTYDACDLLWAVITSANSGATHTFATPYVMDGAPYGFFLAAYESASGNAADVILSIRGRRDRRLS